MRWIDKSGQSPNALVEYLNTQRQTGVNLDYGSFTRKPQLRHELTGQQFGLCAFTGAAIDERMGPLDPNGYIVSASGERLKIKSHNAHLKSQALCRQEMIERGGEPGRTVGEDMDHRNIVAALLVEGAESEMFGASAQGNRLLRVRPTDYGCETRFRFDANGGVQGLDADARATVDTLKLGHRTLLRWRREAIEVFTDPDVIQSQADLNAVIVAMDTPAEGQLPAYCFAIKQVATRLRT